MSATSVCLIPFRDDGSSSVCLYVKLAIPIVCISHLGIAGTVRQCGVFAVTCKWPGVLFCFVCHFLCTVTTDAKTTNIYFSAEHVPLYHFS